MFHPTIDIHTYFQPGKRVHLAGIGGAEKIIAINSDPKAPIFDYADYGIVGDWERVIDQLLKEEIL